MADSELTTKKNPPPVRVDGARPTSLANGDGGSLSDASRDMPSAPEVHDAVVGSPEPLAIGTLDDAPPVPGAGIGTGSRRLGDRVFAVMTSGAAWLVILLVGLIAAFLLGKAIPSLADNKVNFLTSREWSTSPSDLRFGIAGLLYTTVLSSLVALLIAVPVAMGIGLFITQYAPRRLARPVAYVIDLLAAIPSIIYGVWGATVLAPQLTPVQNFLSHIGLGLFDKGLDTKTVFNAGVVLAVMILPIVTAIARDVFDRTPTANKEAAFALGATRWEMIRMAVLPYGKPGVVSGAMLGLGRALGETIAVLLILSKVTDFSWSLFSGGETFASKIAGSLDGFGQNPGPYIAAGLALFVLTFIVNAAARFVVNRKKDFR